MGGTITSESYATAYSAGLAVIFPPSVYSSYGAVSGTDTAFYFSGTGVFLNSTSGMDWEACAPATPVGNGILGGCPTTRPDNGYTDGANGVSHTTTVNATGNTQSYSGTTAASAAGINESASLSASVTSPSTGEYGDLNDDATADENLIVAPTVSDPAGTTGTMVLTYTISPPNVTGSVSGGNGYWYGEWAYQAWMSTGTGATDAYTWGTVDLSSLTGPTTGQVTVPFIFGSATNVKIGYDVGVEWVSTGGPLSASGSFDPMESLTGIQLFGPGDAPITSFGITDSNGTAFGADGVVPEPSTWVLVAGGLSLVVAGVRRVKRG